MLLVWEFQIFFDYIEKNIEKSILPSQIKKDFLKLFENENIWTKQIFELLDIWEGITGEIAVSVLELKKFFLKLLQRKKEIQKLEMEFFLELFTV
ncbi:MAG: hypothetical protein RBR53_05605 [Desulforegulaceae bacterium]|nr:hypothetical protein [Desulforegulaceae bacterium]